MLSRSKTPTRSQMTTDSPDGRDSMGAPPTQSLHSQGLKEDPSSTTAIDMNDVLTFLSVEKGVASVIIIIIINYYYYPFSSLLHLLSFIIIMVVIIIIELLLLLLLLLIIIIIRLFHCVICCFIINFLVDVIFHFSVNICYLYNDSFSNNTQIYSTYYKS